MREVRAAGAASALLERLCAEQGDLPSAAIIVAHPDDEVIGAGSRMPRFKQAWIIHVTDGAPRSMYDARNAGFETWQGYAQARRDELTAALAVAGIGPERMRVIGVPDQGAAFNLVPVTRRVYELLQEMQPEIVLTHPYEGGHPDHDATAFAVHAAQALMEREGLTPPALIEFTSYHERDGQVRHFEFLPNADTEVKTVILTDAEREFKRRMLEAFTTQRSVLDQFPVELERFRLAPRYDFTQRPHAGTLHYEHYDWGMTGERWQELAREALTELGLIHEGHEVHEG
jgi:LmbE family N-acetylglucosaminyl deacetylase